jgi:hypothetical protein
MRKAAENMWGKSALLYRVAEPPGHRLHIFLNSAYEAICAAAHICLNAPAGPFYAFFYAGFYACVSPDRSEIVGRPYRCFRFRDCH